jgi:hypothetical protein
LLPSVNYTVIQFKFLIKLQFSFDIDIKFQEEPIANDENEYKTIKGWDDDGGYHSSNFGIYHGSGVLGDLAGTAAKDQNP